MTLVKRICACGCKRWWKCFPQSASVYFSNIECPSRSKLQRLEYERKEKQLKPRRKYV